MSVCAAARSPLRAAPSARAKWMMALAGGALTAGGNLQACRAAPILSLQHVARGHRGQSSLAAKDGPDHFVDRASLRHQCSRFVVLTQLQIRILHEVIRVRDGSVYSIKL